MKAIGNVKVMKAEERVSSKTGNKFYVCNGVSDENELVSFYASANDAPKEGDIFNQVLAYNKFEAVIRYVKKA